MKREGLLAGGLLALGFAILGGVYAYGTGALSAQSEPEVVDTGGPYLVIEVAAGSAEGATGEVVIDLRDDVAPGHAERLIALAEQGAYDGVVFHRVIDGFMAQTGDVRFGRSDGDTARAGMGGSELPNLAAEFSRLPFQRGVVGMARSQSPDSANSQFFIMFAPAPHLDGQYTVVGRVIEGMDVVDAIRRGSPAQNGTVAEPDRMERVTVRR
ncbi:peptidylprolyl isomerase [Rhodobaculum claviforme]|uniref:Peptidyl-prolyl cis-trans isomerase n=1 Tax=Rhodobaculum claviforme TaxID=1549854 RepID=A0A934TLX8_9RHOB|nr:peptidylprolyl isomerase [Rhodobaculum claviforme]MBK5927951.1 peptidylprolyl isomerase [Rhodobaculum claviforme]